MFYLGSSTSKLQLLHEKKNVITGQFSLSAKKILGLLNDFNKIALSRNHHLHHAVMGGDAVVTRKRLLKGLVACHDGFTTLRLA